MARETDWNDPIFSEEAPEEKLIKEIRGSVPQKDGDSDFGDFTDEYKRMVGALSLFDFEVYESGISDNNKLQYQTQKARALSEYYPLRPFGSRSDQPDEDLKRLCSDEKLNVITQNMLSFILESYASAYHANQNVSAIQKDPKVEGEFKHLLSKIYLLEELDLKLRKIPLSQDTYSSVMATIRTMREKYSPISKLDPLFIQSSYDYHIYDNTSCSDPINFRNVDAYETASFEKHLVQTKAFNLLIYLKGDFTGTGFTQNLKGHPLSRSLGQIVRHFVEHSLQPAPKSQTLSDLTKRLKSNGEPKLSETAVKKRIERLRKSPNGCFLQDAQTTKNAKQYAIDMREKWCVIIRK